MPGGVAFKVGSGLTKAALRAKEAGRYLSREKKLRRFGQGCISRWCSRGVFVGDPDDAGTFGDFMGGPTEINREVKRPLRVIKQIKVWYRRCSVYWSVWCSWYDSW